MTERDGFLPAVPSGKGGFLAEQFKYDKMPPDVFRKATRDLRLMLAYRIAKEIARLKGWILWDDPIIYLGEMQPSPWTEPCISSAASPDTQKVPLVEGIDMSLVPTEHNYLDFLDAARAVGNKLMLFSIDSFLPVLERMFEMDAWQEWPSPGEILAFESRLAYQISQESAQKGRFEVRESLLREYCLMIHEVEGVVAIARKVTEQMFSGNKSEERAVIVSQLEDIVRRVKDTGDVRAELAALQHITKLLGLETEKTKSKDVAKDEFDLEGFKFVDVEPGEKE